MEELRPALIRCAYHILGTLDEAKDVVQEAFIRHLNVANPNIVNLKAYLTRTVINLSINQKNKQKRMRKDYPGEWLPEPVSDDNPDLRIQRRELLSYSLMVLLERLTAQQRAVFILREAFDYDHAEIAAVMGIHSDYSRQLLSRAKRKLKDYVPAQEKTLDETLNRYLDIISSGNMERLEEVLTEDILIVSDGGGKASASRNPIVGIRPSIALISGLHKKFYHGVMPKLVRVNNQPALLYFEHGKPRTCFLIGTNNEGINRLFVIRNPDKLNFLS